MFRIILVRPLPFRMEEYIAAALWEYISISAVVMEVPNEDYIGTYCSCSFQLIDLRLSRNPIVELREVHRKEITSALEGKTLPIIQSLSDLSMDRVFEQSVLDNYMCDRFDLVRKKVINIITNEQI